MADHAPYPPVLQPETRHATRPTGQTGRSDTILPSTWWKPRGKRLGENRGQTTFS